MTFIVFTTSMSLFYLLQLYPLLIKWGVTGLVLEWEDSFPYKNELEEISNGVYSVDDVTQIIEDAREAKLEVIPLIQTFGHLEVNLNVVYELAVKQFGFVNNNNNFCCSLSLSTETMFYTEKCHCFQALYVQVILEP